MSDAYGAQAISSRISGRFFVDKYVSSGAAFTKA
jgi:hypothetical protein